MSPHPERRGPRIVLAILLAIAFVVAVVGECYLNGLEAAYEETLK